MVLPVKVVSSKGASAAFAVEDLPQGVEDGSLHNASVGRRAQQPVGGSASGWRHRLTALAGKVYRPQPPELSVDITFVILAAVTYGVLFFSMGSAFLPGNAAWATLLLWAAAQIGAFIAWQLRLPRVVGMLCAGLLMKNAGWSATTAFPSKWGVQMRAGALATIFLRCGLELDFGTMRRFKYPAMRLALLPGLVEAFYDGGLAVAVFDMPVLLAFTMGFILKAVGPGLVVPAMFQLQKTGLGRDQGIPSTVVIAASFDDIVAITGYSIFSTVAITGQGNVAWQIASGPLQVVFGILGGLIGGVLLGCTRLFDSRLKRLVGLYGGALLLMYFLEYWNLLSGGALGALFVGLVASNAWEKGFPQWGSLGASFAFSPEIERIICVLWNWVWEPMLFVTIGNSIYFKTLDGGIIPRSLLIVCTGVTLRTILTYFFMMGFGYNWREKLFYAVAWTPKATVQAALSAAPLALINQYKADDPDFAQWQKWGDEILVTGIFAIIICGTLGTLAIHMLAPYLLMPAEGSNKSSDESEGELEEAEGRQAGPGAAAVSHCRLAGPCQQAGSEAQLGGAHVEAGDEGGSPRKGLHHRRRPSFGTGLSEQDGGHVPRASHAGHELLAEYLDAIRLLTAAVHDERKTKGDLVVLSDRVLVTQKRLEAAMDKREPSVRELFRTASALARTFVMRPPSAHAGHAHAGASSLARQGSGSGHGGAHFRGSQDAPGRLQSRQGPVSGKASEGGNHPTSPEDMA